MSDKLASATTYAASGGAILFGLNANEIGVLVGAACAMLGVVVGVANYLLNRHYKRLHYSLEQQRRFDDVRDVEAGK